MVWVLAALLILNVAIDYWHLQELKVIAKYMVGIESRLKSLGK